MDRKTGRISTEHHRRSMRLRSFDYSTPGAYFVTVCTHKRECILGKLVDGKMELYKSGRVVEAEWIRSSDIREEIKLDVYQIMPNHFHAIVVILEKTNQSHNGLNIVGANGRSPLLLGTA